MCMCPDKTISSHCLRFSSVTNTNSSTHRHRQTHTQTHTHTHTHSPTSWWMVSWQGLISWEWMGQNYNSVGAVIALLLLQRSMSDCWNAGMQEEQSMVSICLFVCLFLSSHSEFLRFLHFFYFSLLSCLLLSTFFFTHPPPSSFARSYFHGGTYSLLGYKFPYHNHTTDVLVMPLYFSSHGVMCFSSSSVTVRPLSFHFFKPIRHSWPLCSSSWRVIRLYLFRDIKVIKKIFSHWYYTWKTTFLGSAGLFQHIKGGWEKIRKTPSDTSVERF